MQRFFLISLIFMMGAFFTQAQTVTEQTELHVVKKGETLYHLSQIYNTTVSHLLDLNPAIVNNKLETGASVKVPHVKNNTAKAVKIGPPQYLTPVTYVVAKGETLYSISKKTNNEVETVRMWNDLKNDDIKAGQKIIVGYGTGGTPKKGTTTVAATSPATSATQTQQKVQQPATATASSQPATTKTQPVTAPIKTNASKTITTTPVATVTKPETKTSATTATAIATNVPANTKTVVTAKPEGKLSYMSEKGVATWSKGNNDDGQFYALHPTAPVGTVITVKNMMNNSSVQVKVIGKLPNTSENQNVMIKLSGSAAKQLNVLDDKFLATINYMGVKGE